MRRVGGGGGEEKRRDREEREREWSREGETKRKQAREEVRKMRAFGSEEVDERATMRGEKRVGGGGRVRGREGGSWMFERTQFA